ncbi:hypothetical protein CFAM422_002591 [Trichoderma lentiforme]|uniref:Uncharacterized protein n=1 Tax=Trichoderma lentiforme TaxID=1567552 RepID=A0A9P4XJ82_9HYPO|nr:hypothetical protein CFAM422_002591 [Trichoderma lentiforme]
MLHGSRVSSSFFIYVVNKSMDVYKRLPLSIHNRSKGGRKKNRSPRAKTDLVRAVSLLLLAGTFHEHLLPISIHQQPLFPAMDFCPASTCICLHVLHIFAYRISRVRVTLLSIHEAQLPSRRRFAGAKAPARKRPYSNRGSSLPPGPASLAVAESPTTPGSTDNPFDRTNRRELGRSTFVDAVTHRLCIAAAFHVKLTCPISARSQPKCMQNHECQVGMSLAVAGSLEIAAGQAQSWKNK